MCRVDLKPFWFLGPQDACSCSGCTLFVRWPCCSLGEAELLFHFDKTPMSCWQNDMCVKRCLMLWSVQQHVSRVDAHSNVTTMWFNAAPSSQGTRRTLHSLSTGKTHALVF